MRGEIMRWIICLAFVLFNSIGIFAQATFNTENDFLVALDKANNLNWFLQSSPYRTINTGEIVLNFKGEKVGKQLNSYKTVLEFDKKTGIHAIHETSKNSVRENYESIVISGKNSKYFERNDNKDWRQMERLSKNVGGTLALPTSREYKKIQESPETNQTTVNYNYLGKEEINNQIADVYVTVERYSGKNVRTQTKRFWFAPNGKILKLDLEIIIESDGGFSRSHYTQTWEADENIKIEAPKLLVAQ